MGETDRGGREVPQELSRSSGRKRGFRFTDLGDFFSLDSLWNDFVARVNRGTLEVAMDGGIQYDVSGALLAQIMVFPRSSLLWLLLAFVVLNFFGLRLMKLAKERRSSLERDDDDMGDDNDGNNRTRQAGGRRRRQEIGGEADVRRGRGRENLGRHREERRGGDGVAVARRGAPTPLRRVSRGGG